MTIHYAPRRLSVEDHHPCAQHVRVSINGIDVTHVIAYDCDAGWIKRYENSPFDGKPVISKIKDEYMIETLRGSVEAVYQ